MKDKQGSNLLTLKPSYTAKSPVPKRRRIKHSSTDKTVESDNATTDLSEDKESGSDTDNEDDAPIINLVVPPRAKITAPAPAPAPAAKDVDKVNDKATAATAAPDMETDVQEAAAQQADKDKDNNEKPPSPATRYPKQDRRPPQRYEAAQAVRAFKFNLFSLKNLMMIMILALALTHTTTCMKTKQLSSQLGTAYLCSVGNDGVLFSMGEEPNCEVKNYINEQVHNIIVRPYFIRTISPIFKIWSCSIQRESVTTFTSFFAGKGITAHTIHFYPFDIIECQRIIANRAIEFKKLHKISANTYSNTTHSLETEYKYCCYSYEQVQYNLIIKEMTASYNYHTHRMFSASVSMRDCDIYRKYCLLSDQILIWDENTVNTCEVKAGKMVNGERRGNQIISHEAEFAVTLTGLKKHVCSEILLDTNEGLLIKIVDHKPLPQSLKQLIQMNNDNNTISTTNYATMAYAERYLETFAHHLFTINYIQICNIQKSRFHLLKNLAITQPTLAARALLKTSHISAKLSGEYLTIFHCMPIKEYDIRHTDECYLDIPIRFLIDDKYYDGYLSLTELEIVTKSYAKDCKHFNPQYYGNDPVYVWNGKHFNVTKIDYSDIILLSAFPKDHHLSLHINHVFDPRADQIDKLTNLLEVENSLNALTKLFQLSANNDNIKIDIKQLKELTKTAGLDTAEFVNNAVHKTVNLFAPPKWVMHLLLAIIVIVIVITILVIFLFVYRKFAYLCKCSNKRVVRFNVPVLPDEILPLHRDQTIMRISHVSTSPDDLTNIDNIQPEINNVVDSHIVSENINDEELPPPPEIPIDVNEDVQIIESEINVDNAIVIHVVDETITVE